MPYKGQQQAGSGSDGGGAGSLSFSGFWNSAKSLANSVKAEVTEVLQEGAALTSETAASASRELRSGVSQALKETGLSDTANNASTYLRRASENASAAMDKVADSANAALFGEESTAHSQCGAAQESWHQSEGTKASSSGGGYSGKFGARPAAGLHDLQAAAAYRHQTKRAPVPERPTQPVKSAQELYQEEPILQPAPEGWCKPALEEEIGEEMMMDPIPKSLIGKMLD